MVRNHGTRSKISAGADPGVDCAVSFMGIRLAEFLHDFQQCFQELLDNTEAYPTTVAIKDELVPKIQYVEQETMR